MDNISNFNDSTWVKLIEIKGNIIQSIGDIEVAPDHKVWFLGQLHFAALFYFDNEDFFEIAPPVHYEYSAAANIGISSDSHIWTILHDSGNFVVGEYDGVKWILFDLSSIGVDVSFKDDWITDHKGNLYLLSGNASAFAKYNGNNWEKISIPVSRIDYISQKEPLYIDEQDHLWISLKNNTLIQFDGAMWTTLDLNQVGLTTGHPDNLLIDGNGHQWFIYEDNTGWPAYTLFNSDSHSAVQFDLSNSDLPTNNVTTLLIDPKNNKWLGSRYGLLKYDGSYWSSIVTPDSISSDLPIAVTENEGVWMYPYNSRITQFDGFEFRNIDLSDPDGLPYDALYWLATDRNGLTYVATGEDHVLVYDHGNISYLDSMKVHISPSIIANDHSTYVGFDNSGRLYSMGFSFAIHRLENDNTWTEIPFWQSDVEAVDFQIAPNGDIWVAYSIVFNGYNKLKVYNGIGWEDFQFPYVAKSYPLWDSNGNIWILSDEGLCKKENDTWICYNRANSPVIPTRIEKFTIDRYNNIWMILNSGGVLLFNEKEIIDLPTAINEVNASIPLLCVYPNPSNEEINIEIHGDVGDLPYRYDILDLIGRSIYSGNLQNGQTGQLAVDQLTQGMYIVRVVSKNKYTVTTFIKN
jgi:streptogramin lyase